MDIYINHHGRLTLADVFGEGFMGHGEALRSKKDVASPEVGRAIALGRALHDLAFQVEAHGHSLTVTKEEYARVTRLIEHRQPSAAQVLRGIVNAEMLEPDVAKREQFCTQGCDPLKSGEARPYSDKRGRHG